MGPIAKEVAANVPADQVKFVTFDFTSQETKAKARADAKELGVAGTYAKHEGDTGFALIYDTQSQTVVKKVSARDDAASWQAAIQGVIGG